MRRIRVLLHALDRTGPPMLALAWLGWLRQHHRELTCDTVAFRGGALLPALERLGPTWVLLDDHEAWNHHQPDPSRVEELRNRMQRLPPADVTLLVSVSAGQCLDLLPPDGGPVVTWVVERGEDLHWLGPPVNVDGRTDVYLAGSAGSMAELRELVDPRGRTMSLSAEFVEVPALEPSKVSEARARHDPDGGHLVVMGAGIGTWRKGPDLFLELAAALQRRRPDRARLVWFGGESDPLIPRLRSWTEDLGLTDIVQWMDSTDQIEVELASADVLAHTARLDAFPLVCLHAAAVGTPVIAFAGCGGTEEMFGDDFTGVDYPDVHAFAEVVAELDRTGALTDLGRRQSGRVRRDFSIEACAAALLRQLAESSLLTRSR